MGSDREVLADFYQNLSVCIRKGTLTPEELTHATDAFFELEVRRFGKDKSDKDKIRAMFVGFCALNLIDS